jgi:hypothetical protein
MVIAEKDLESRVLEWADRLVIDGWKFTVETCELTDNAAECETDEYWNAHLKFDIARISEKELDAFIVHELLHVHFDPIRRFIEGAVKTKRLREYGFALEEQTIERFTEALLEVYRG